MIAELRIDKMKSIQFKFWCYKDVFGIHVLIYMFGYCITIRKLPKDYQKEKIAHV